MRTIFTYLLVLYISLTAPLHAQETEKSIPSEIKQVTVFLKGAQVTRQARVSLKPGTTILKMAGIAPAIQEQSIQVEAPVAVKILSVSFHVNYIDELKTSEQTSSLDGERKRILELITQEKAQLDVYKEEEDILKTNKSIGGTQQGVNIDELKIAMDYFRERLNEIKQLQLRADRNIRNYNEAIGKLDAQLAQLNNHDEHPSGEIVIKLSVKRDVVENLQVKYLVSDAGWYPSYDIRAKDVQSPVSITYKANVKQNTGEDWPQVALTISSADPSAAGARPVMRPWYLGFNNHVANGYAPTISGVGPSGSNNFVRGRIVSSDGEPLPGVNVNIRGTTVGTVTDASGFYSLPLTSDAQSIVISFVGYQTQELPIMSRNVIDVKLNVDVAALSEVVITGYGTSNDRFESELSGRAAGVATENRAKRSITATEIIRQTNIEYTIDEPITVKSDGEVRTTDMVEYALKASYEYYCAPKLDNDAFLTARIIDWDEYNFMEGEASLFFEGKFIGKSILDTRNTSDTLTLSLGRDANVLVTREKIKDISSRQFIGTNQKAVFAYDIQIRNKKSQSITILIEDQIPVSTDKEIDISKVEDSKASYDQESGKVSWRKTIDAGKTEKLKLTYAVRFPKGSQMILE